MEYGSPGVRLITRFYWFAPAIALGFAAMLLPARAMVVCLFLNHALYVWGCHCALGTEAGESPSESLRLRFPAQLIFQAFFGLAAALLIGVPVEAVSRLELDLALNAGIIGLCALIFLVIALKLWPAHGMIMALPASTLPGTGIGASPETCARATRMAMELTRGHIERTLEGLPLILGIATVSAMPLVLALLRSRVSDGLYWGLTAGYLLLLTPWVYGLMLPTVRRLAGELVKAEEQSRRSTVPDAAATVVAPTPVEPGAAPASAAIPYEDPLMRAAASCNLSQLQAQFDHGASFDITENGDTPLIALVNCDHPDRTRAVEWMLDQGADPAGVDKAGRTALHHAARNGDSELIDVLLMKGADMDVLSNQQRSPLAEACAAGNWPEAELLIRQGSALNPDQGEMPLHAAASTDKDDPVGVETLIRRGADVNRPGKLGRTALMGAAMRGNALIADVLLKAGAEINARDQFGSTALMEAARSGANHVLERFVFWHPETEHRDKPGRTALLVAVSSKRADPETIRLLLAMGADPRGKNRDGREAGELAVAAGRWRIARALGMDPNQPADPTKVSNRVANDSDDGPTVVDLSPFETEEDRAWAKRQMTQRSRTQLEYAGASEEPEAVEESEPEAAPEAPVDAAPVEDSAPEDEPTPEAPEAVVSEAPEEAPEPTEDEPRETEEAMVAEQAQAEEPAEAVADAAPAEEEVVTDEAAVEAAIEAVEPEVVEEATSSDTEDDEEASLQAYNELLAAAVNDDIERMQAILGSHDAPEWWLVSAFLNGVAKGNVIGPRWLLDNGLQANAVTEGGQPLLRCIVQQSPPNPQIIAVLLDHGARCMPDSLALNWLAGYADHQHEREASEADPELEAEIIELLPRLVERGADVDAIDERKRTALHWAVRYRSPAFVQALLELDAEVDAQDIDGCSPLFWACETPRSDQTGIIRLLTRAGANPKLGDSEGHTPMTLAMEAQDQTLLKMLMLARKGRELKREEDGRSEDLIQAAIEGNLGRVKRILGKGSDVNQRDAKGCTAILRAAGAGHPNIVTSLLAANADMNIPARNGTTPLGAAVLAGHREIVRLLVDRGADVDQPQQFGITPLMLASARWNAPMVSLLLKLGADVNRRDEAEGTALMAAVQNALVANYPEAAEATVQALIEAGVDVNATNDEGQTALMLLLGVRARSTDSANTDTLRRLTRILVEADASLDSQDLTGWSALHAAAAHGFYEPALELVEAGANRRLRDINGLSPCDLAMDNAHDQLVDLFIQH